MAPRFGRPSNNLTAGLVGLANVGKSTLFQALTHTSLGNPGNYPFATITPTSALTPVTSPMLTHLTQLYNSKKSYPSTLRVFDIAGLVRGASDNKGLGNAFLNDIRQVDGIYHLVRAFRNSEITHIEGGVNPVRDAIVVQDELLLKDMEWVEGSIAKLNHQKGHLPVHEAIEMKNQVLVLEKAYEVLMEGKRVIDGDWNDDEIEALNGFNLLTAKPTVLLINVSKEDYLSGKNEFLKGIQSWRDEWAPGTPTVMVSPEYEKELNDANDNITDLSSMPSVVSQMRDSLGLISFYTCGPQEVRQWTIREGTLAQDAAGVIHSDLRDTFINAELIKYEDVIGLDAPFDEKKLKAKGKISRVGKAYEVENGDILHFNAAAGKRR